MAGGYVSNLVRVIAVGQTQDRDYDSLDFLSLEVYLHGFTAVLRKRRLSVSPGGVYLHAKASDDVGNTYTATFGGAPGGSQGVRVHGTRHMSFARPLILFSPPLHRDARELNVEFVEFAHTHGSTFEPRPEPWVFTVPIPPEAGVA